MQIHGAQFLVSRGGCLAALRHPRRVVLSEFFLRPFASISPLFAFLPVVRACSDNPPNYISRVTLRYTRLRLLLSFVARRVTK